MMTIPKLSVIISTYNKPKDLFLVLHGYLEQTERDFEIIIADDGSTEDTKQMLVKFSKSHSLKINHVWQEDKGFQKTKILNKAIQHSNSNYLLFTDGDCIPRKDLIEKHITLRKEHHFLSGSYYKLNERVSAAITLSVIKEQSCFNAKWLKRKGQEVTFKMNKLTSFGFKEWFLNTFTTTKATWDGCNVSGWKKDILAVNGFDERMQYGGEDRELGERLVNLGIKPIQARYSLVCVHLHHERPYKNDEAFKANLLIRSQTKKQHIIKTEHGINS
jgi:glycosyltransferase involved in cell wall biosynthesis